ncbi:hypothetical protein EBB07_07375 [Paenibacillaceae bacterium]|nr:hypothetical protein EBB07_07375 [Paenibacillaceae bacterium]
MRGTQVQYISAEVYRCRGARYTSTVHKCRSIQVQRCRGTEVYRCRSAEVHKYQKYTSIQVQRCEVHKYST